MAYKIRKLKYEELEHEKLNFLMPIQYEIDWDGVTYEFLINYKPRSKKAVVFGTGAIIKDKPLPVFSRAKWMHSMSYNGIWYFDPTVYLGDLVLGWGYGTNQRWYLKDIAHLVEIFLKKMKVPNENTLFFGSSGGGFTSIILASMFNSRATAINPQLNVRDYFQPSVKLLAETVLNPGESLIPHRVDVSEFLKENNIIPVIHLVENLFSKLDVQTQMHKFLENLVQQKQDATERLHIDFYSERGGHNGMPSKEYCLRIIEEDLNRPIPQKRNVSFESIPVSVVITPKCEITGNRLKVTVDVEPANEFTLYAYYLCKGPGVQTVVKQGYSSKREMEFVLDEPGSYFLRVFVKSKYYAEDDYSMDSVYTDRCAYSL